MAIEEASELLAGDLTAEEIVGRHKADKVLTDLASERRVENHDWLVALHSRPHGVAQRGVIKGGEHNGVGVVDRELLDDSDLLSAIILLERSFPDDLGIKFFAGGTGAIFNGFPKAVGGALGDDGNFFAGREANGTS